MVEEVGVEGEVLTLFFSSRRREEGIEVRLLE
jgi:hypothetical protein